MVCAESRPLFVLRLGQLDIKGVIRSVGVDGLVAFALSVMEEGLVKCAQTTRKLGKPVSSWALLVDLEGLSMRHVWRPGIAALKQLNEICEANYPGESHAFSTFYLLFAYPCRNIGSNGNYTRAARIPRFVDIDRAVHRRKHTKKNTHSRRRSRAQSGNNATLYARREYSRLPEWLVCGS
jgi:hypothetical protein